MCWGSRDGLCVFAVLGGFALKPVIDIPGLVSTQKRQEPQSSQSGLRQNRYEHTQTSLSSDRDNRDPHGTTRNRLPVGYHRTRAGNVSLKSSRQPYTKGWQGDRIELDRPAVYRAG